MRFLEFIFGKIFDFGEHLAQYVFDFVWHIFNQKRVWYDWQGNIHRNEYPAVQQEDGTVMWFQHGKLHRDEDLPAIIHSDGTEEWWFNGLRHRGHDRPAIIASNGFMEWWDHGVLHRSGRNPAIVGRIGEEEWWVDGIKCNPSTYYINWRKEGF